MNYWCFIDVFTIPQCDISFESILTDVRSRITAGANYNLIETLSSEVSLCRSQRLLFKERVHLFRFRIFSRAKVLLSFFCRTLFPVSTYVSFHWVNSGIQKYFETITKNLFILIKSVSDTTTNWWQSGDKWQFDDCYITNLLIYFPSVKGHNPNNCLL